PVLILAPTERSTKVCARPLDALCNDDAALLLDANDEELDISSIPLGYVNIGRDSIYCSRVPIRRAKQGVSPDNIHIVSHCNETEMLLRQRFDGMFGFDLSYLIPTIEDEYPSVSDVLEAIRSG